MGKGQSKLPKILDAECEEFSSISKFKVDEIRFLYQHFRKIARSIEDDGVIDYPEFLSTLKVRDSVAARQIYRVFDINQDNRINFREFVLGMNFILETDQFALSEILFKIFDVNQRGLFGIEEIVGVLGSMVEQFPHVKFPPGFLREWVRRDLAEFRHNCIQKRDQPGLRLSSRDLLSEVVAKLENLDTFTFDEQSFFVYFRFNSVTAQWMQGDLRVLQDNARQLLARGP